MVGLAYRLPTRIEPASRIIIARYRSQTDMLQPDHNGFLRRGWAPLNLNLPCNKDRG
jgi:hypothetical protein